MELGPCVVRCSLPDSLFPSLFHPLSPTHASFSVLLTLHDSLFPSLSYSPSLTHSPLSCSPSGNAVPVDAGSAAGRIRLSLFPSEGGWGGGSPQETAKRGRGRGECGSVGGADGGAGGGCEGE